MATVGLRASFHGAYYPSSCTEQPDVVTVADSDVCAIACRALDLMFPREDCEDEWSAREDERDGQVIDGDYEEDDPGSEVGSDCSTEEGSDEDDDDYNGQVRDKDKEIDCPGKHYSQSEAEEIECKWLRSYRKLVGSYANLSSEMMDRGEEDTRFPPYPLYVFPEATAQCIPGEICYHSAYKTYDTSTTESSLGYHTPQQMLQFFSMCLSSFDPPHPVSVYGIVAVRDELDQRRNYIFNRPRDDAVLIGKQDSFVLPLCSPCRGIYVLERALLEVDLWVKKEGDVSADKQLLSAYAEVDIRGDFDDMCYARIVGDVCNLDIEYIDLAGSVETVIQVYAKVDHPRHVRFTALSTGYGGNDIVLFDDKLSGNEEKLFQYIVPVKANEKLDVLLKVDHSLFQWSFQDEHVGAVHSPDYSIFEYGRFLVRVFFAPKDSQ